MKKLGKGPWGSGLSPCLQVRVPEVLYRRLVALAKRRGTTPSAVVRECLEKPSLEGGVR